MTQVPELGGPADLAAVTRDLEPHLARHLGLKPAGAKRPSSQ
jgi:hypothetical protein